MSALPERTVAALSLVMVTVMLVATGMLAGAMKLDYSPLWSSRMPEGLWQEVNAESRLEGGMDADEIQDPRMAEIRLRFQQAVMMLHAGRYEYAATALHRVLALSPRLTDAHVNMGFALLGLQRYQEAEAFFRNAIELDPYKGNAYWGLAEVFEAQGDLPAALGAMRTYIHLAPPGDPYVRRARAALWEWEDRLQRGPRPPEEAQWLAEQGQRWEERNSPSRDAPAADQRELPVQSLH